MDVLPVEYNPKRGYVFTANGMKLPEDYPIDKMISFVSPIRV